MCKFVLSKLVLYISMSSTVCHLSPAMKSALVFVHYLEYYQIRQPMLEGNK